mmetsp:Transcript_3776/g.12327  ORF Transcript_3776/g.12327 Transcript_3776/m.12327 type:complete len:240 (-) Transcript_3776:359-1078(-)
MTAVGVARPRAQGQATTRTDTAKRKEKRKSEWGWSSTLLAKTPNHREKLNEEHRTTRRTKCLATTSAMASTLVFSPWARSTSLTTPANIVSSPTADTDAVNAEGPAFTVPATTSDSGFFTTGIASPVTRLSSTRVVPSTTRPSAGTRSPGRTLKRSPLRRAAASTRSSALVLRSTATAKDGCRPMRSLNAWDVAPLARASKNFPQRTKATRRAAVSKQACSSPNGDDGRHVFARKTAAE